MKRIIILLPFMLMMVVGGYAYYKISMPIKNKAAMTAEYNLSSEQLFNDFQFLEKTANAKYKNHLLQVKGIVKELRFNLDGEVMVLLEGGNSLFAVSCYLAPCQQGFVNQIKEKDEITLTGICKGMMADVILENCTLN